MRKVLCLFLLVLFTCGCYPTKSTSVQDSAVTSTITPVSQLSNKSTSTSTPESTPTEMPTDPYFFGDADISFGELRVTFTDGLLEGKELSATIISPKNLGIYASTSEGLKAGNGVGVIRPEKYGNLLLNLHSGYLHGNRLLEAEFLRYLLEKWGKQGVAYVESSLSKINGSRGIMQINNSSFDVEILGGVRLEPTEAKELQTNPEKVLDIVTKEGNLAIGDTSIFEKIKNGSHEILISFCGWGPNQETTYYRYVLLMNVIESTDTPDNIK